MGCPPAPVYKGARGRRPDNPCRRAMRRNPPPSRSRTPLFPTPTRRGKGRGRGRRKRGLHPLSNSDQRGGARLLPFGLSSLCPYGPIRPIYSRRIPVTLRYSEKYPNHSEPFRCPNIVVQYIDLYVSTISRLLVLSPISSGTPNYLCYINSHKLRIPIVTEL